MRARRMLLCLLFAAGMTLRAQSGGGCKPDLTAPTDADGSRYRKDFGIATRLYREMLKTDRTAATAGLIRTMIQEAHFTDAMQLSAELVQASPNSVVAHTARAEFYLSELQMAQATAEVRQALALDRCSGRALYTAARLEQLSNQHAAAWHHLQLAHALAPNDDDILRSWMWADPDVSALDRLTQYVESTDYLYGTDRDDMPGRIVSAREYRGSSCSVVAPKGGVTLPLRHAADTGLLTVDASLHGVTKHLGLTTVSQGLVLSHDTARRLGLKPREHFTSSQLYRGGRQHLYTAVLDSMRLGDVEFRDCIVTVAEDTYGGDRDLIGISSLRDFLIDVDPAGVLTLSGLAPLPGNNAANWPVLEGSTSGIRSRTQGQWEPYNGIQPPGMEHADRLYEMFPNYDMSSYLVQASIGPGMPLPFTLALESHENILEHAHTQAAMTLDATFREQGKALPPSVRQAMGGREYFVSFGGQLQPVNNWTGARFDETAKANGIDIAGELGYPALGQVRMTFDLRDGLVLFRPTEKVHAAGF